MTRGFVYFIKRVYVCRHKVRWCEISPSADISLHGIPTSLDLRKKAAVMAAPCDVCSESRICEACVRVARACLEVILHVSRISGLGGFFYRECWRKAMCRGPERSEDKEAKCVPSDTW